MINYILLGLYKLKGVMKRHVLTKRYICIYKLKLYFGHMVYKKYMHKK